MRIRKFPGYGSTKAIHRPKNEETSLMGQTKGAKLAIETNLV